jgi:hypothetical protein
MNMAEADFTRDHMVYLSFYALSARLKGQSATLLNHLTGKNVFTSAHADAVMQGVAAERMQ